MDNKYNQGMQYDYGQWWLVAINVLIFGYFIWTSFKPQNKVDWKTFQTFMAFIVALFVEMYGFPLTIFFLTSYFGNRFFGIDFTHNNGHLLEAFLGVKGDPHFNFLHILSNLLISGGIILLGASWKVLYHAVKKNSLATAGPYKYLRHPQYLALILVIIGFLLQWPTIMTLLMAPVLIWRYINLAKSEEKQIQEKFGKTYQLYESKTPGFLFNFKDLITDLIHRLPTKKAIA